MIMLTKVRRRQFIRGASVQGETSAIMVRWERAVCNGAGRLDLLHRGHQRRMDRSFNQHSRGMPGQIAEKVHCLVAAAFISGAGQQARCYAVTGFSARISAKVSLATSSASRTRGAPT